MPPRQPPPRCCVVTTQAQKVIHGMLQECDYVFGSLTCFNTIDDDKRFNLVLTNPAILRALQ